MKSIDRSLIIGVSGVLLVALIICMVSYTTFLWSTWAPVALIMTGLWVIMITRVQMYDTKIEIGKLVDFNSGWVILDFGRKAKKFFVVNHPGVDTWPDTLKEALEQAKEGNKPVKVMLQYSHRDKVPIYTVWLLKS